MSEENECLGAFERVLREIDEPETDEEKHLSRVMDRAVEAAIVAARASGKKATVTVKLTVQAGVETRITFTGSVDAKLPRPEVPGVTLFVDEDFAMSTKGPQQQELGMAVPEAPRPPRRPPTH